jgi:hypothetical protein
LAFEYKLQISSRNSTYNFFKKTIFVTFPQKSIGDKKIHVTDKQVNLADKTEMAALIYT